MSKNLFFNQTKTLNDATFIKWTNWRLYQTHFSLSQAASFQCIIEHPIYSRVSAQLKHGGYCFSLFFRLCLVPKYKYCNYSQPSRPIMQFKRSLHKWNSTSHKLLVFNVLLPLQVIMQYLHILNVAGTASPLTRICTFHVPLTHVRSSNAKAVSTPNHHGRYCILFSVYWTKITIKS